MLETLDIWDAKSLKDIRKLTKVSVVPPPSKSVTVAPLGASIRAAEAPSGSVVELTATTPTLDDVFWKKKVPDDGSEIEVVLGELFAPEPGAKILIPSLLAFPVPSMATNKSIFPSAFASIPISAWLE